MDNSDYAKNLIDRALETPEVKDALNRFNCGEHTSGDWDRFTVVFEDKIRELYVSDNPNQAEAKAVVVISLNMRVFASDMIVGCEYILKHSLIRIYVGGIEIKLPKSDSNITTFSVKDMDSSKILHVVKSME